MRVGMAAVFQNPGRARSDFDVYGDDLRLVDLCEPLGFDSIWMDIRRRVGNDHFVGVFSYAGMPAAEAERNMRLFAKEVMPPLQRLESGASR
jgi:hypothetical protein